VSAPRPLRERDATLDDLGVVASWVRTENECRLWAGPGVSFPLRRDVLAAEIRFSEGGGLALEDGGGPCAFGQVVWNGAERRAHLARVIVRPDARGRGLGRALVRALLARAAARGASSVTLNVYEENAPALRLYASEGFVPDRDPSRPAPAGGLALVRTAGADGA
jgi:[ribosomal protein S18]-alanine N-acetyltransferase